MFSAAPIAIPRSAVISGLRINADSQIRPRVNKKPTGGEYLLFINSTPLRNNNVNTTQLINNLSRCVKHYVIPLRNNKINTSQLILMANSCGKTNVFAQKRGFSQKIGVYPGFRAIQGGFQSGPPRCCAGTPGAPYTLIQGRIVRAPGPVFPGFLSGESTYSAPGGGRGTTCRGSPPDGGPEGGMGPFFASVWF